VERLSQMPEQLKPRQVLYITLLLTLAAGLLRFYRVDESVHPDSLLWFSRVQRFWVALDSHQFNHTYQAPHPGVMLMWITGLVMKLQHHGLTGPIDAQGVYALKMPGVLVGTLAASLTFPLLLGCLGKTHWRPALMLALLFATEPYLLEQSRMAHLDMAALGFAWLGLLVAIYAYERSCRWCALGAGSLFALACLSKFSLAPLPVTLMLILTGTTVLSRFRDWRGVQVAALATVGTVITLYAFWPALWTQPIDTLSQMLKETSKLAEHGHGRAVNGRIVRDPGVVFYVNWVAEVTPFETGILAALGACVLGSLRHLRKHYLWLIVSLLPYLVMISIAPKKLTRYALPIAPLLLVLVSAAIEWATPRLRDWLRRAPLALAALLPLLLVVRFGRAASILPSAQQCTHWPGYTCERPADMYFMRDLGVAMNNDWIARKGKGTPRLLVAKREPAAKPDPMSAWQPSKKVKGRGADYAILWDRDYDDAEQGKLSAAARQAYGKLGRELVTVRHRGKVVARLYRADGGDE
jgi:hypothetical protein